MKFLGFIEICAGLPGVKPRAAMSDLRAAYDDLLLNDEHETRIGTHSVSRDELAQIFVEIEDGFYASQKVSSKGATLLVRLYLSNALPMKSKATPVEPAAFVTDYCKQGADPVLKKEMDAKQKAEYKERLATPSNIQASEFTFTLLNDLFWMHCGKGEAKLDVGSVSVKKSITPYTSNSGASRDLEVRFTWIDEGGVLHERVKPSSYADNRRNDEARNFGLPE